MTVATKTVQNCIDYAGNIRNFACGYKVFTNPTFTGTGTGKLLAFGATNATNNETWTITCTSAATPGSEVWSVVGSTTGALASATTDVLYNTSGITFIIIADSVANFAVNDYFTVVVTGTGPMQTSGEAATLQQQYFTRVSGNEYKLAIQFEFAGVGTDTINVCLESYTHIVDNYYYIRWRGAQQYLSGNDIDNQLNLSSNHYQHIGNESMEAWFAGNDYGLTTSIKVGVTYHHAYAAFIIPYASPGQYPFPLLIGADSNDAVIRYSDVTYKMRSFVDPSYFGAELMAPDNTWKGLSNYTSTGNNPSYDTTSLLTGSGCNVTLPYGPNAGDGLVEVEPTHTGVYAVWPIQITLSSLQVGIFGELRFVGACCGGLLSSEDTITADGDSWIVFQNINRVTAKDYFCVRQA